MKNANIAKIESESRKVWPRGLWRPNLGLTSFRYVLIFLFLAIPLVSFAQTAPQPSILLDDPAAGRTFNDLLNEVIKWLTIILVPILTIIVIIGAFKMLTAKDNEAEYAKGKKIVTNALIGAAVILVANGIIYVIESFLSTGGGPSNPPNQL